VNELAATHETYADLSTSTAFDGKLATLPTPAQRHQEHSRRLAWRLISADATVLVLWAALFLGVVALAGGQLAGPVAEIAIFGAVVPVVSAVGGLYGRRRIEGTSLRQAGPLATALISAGFVWLLFAPVISGYAADRAALQVLVAMPLLFCVMLLLRTTVASRTIRNHPEKILILGAGEVGQRLARKLMSDPSGGATVVGFVDDHPMPLPPDLENLHVWPAATALGAAIAKTEASRLAIAFSGESSEGLLQLVRRSEFGPMPVSVVPRLYEITPAHARLSELAGMPVVNLESASLSRGQLAVKRTLDVVGSLFGLILFSPILAVVALAIKIDSPGPIFFRQARTGRGGETFEILKFRTMIRDAEGLRHELSEMNDKVNGGPLFKMRNDPRTTRVGRVLRRYNIDELPQLFNVLGGSMSLIGPRPFVVHEAEQIGDWGARRNDLTPGITGLWQISDRNEVSYEEMIQLDYLYVANWSVWWDLRILLQTVPLVLSGKAAN
jgi:exopolysaccharide biosynthesis polyprenyl glycosylphosphotransferase